MKFKKTVTVMLTLAIFLSPIANSTIYASERTSEDMVAYDQENHALSYSHEELVQLAIKNSNEITRISQQIKRGQIVRDNLGNQYTYTPVGIGTGEVEDIQARSLVQGLRAADTNLQVLRRQIETLEDKLAYDVQATMNKVLLAKQQLNLNIARKELALAELRLANIKHNTGTLSKFELTKLQNDFEEAVKRINNLELTLESAYLELNNLTGLDKDLRYELKAVENQDEKAPSLEGHIRRVLAESSTIWSLEQNVRLAEISLSLHSYNAGQDPYRAKQVDVATAKLNLNNTKEVMEHSLRSLYQTLEQLKEAREILEINLQKINHNYELVKIQVDLGMAIPLELIKLENAIEELKYQLLENELRYEESLHIYKKPWVVGS
ncbi:hypothetical protein CACET_c01290 [Clostridium aceticum]|uniref:Uncharacterized protein n=1 Tax=Clostridium aceticum TaxID=84022 RepID=A0A0D8IDF3_9CLOT|nr:TolC family protein [Clostridium aceticum]AKL93647.1 hypothetical protein CACET_c01290 [Clostridium aceticum]KJF27226.1 hypothetical protein TZ02_09175 [Clostridium aceticum]